jgi:hypothetical protein
MADAGGTQCRQVIVDLRQCHLRGVNEVAMASPPGQGFQAQGAAAGEKVCAPGAVNIGGQPIEQGLTNPIAGGPQPLCRREGEFATTPLPADDTQPAVDSQLARLSCAFP